MADTTKLLLPLMAQNQAQKHVTFNEAMLWADILIHLSVKDRDLTAPPGSPADGDTYIVATGGTGLWAGKDLNVAAWINAAWKFFPPREGWQAWIEDENQPLFWSGSAWVQSIQFSGFLKTPAATTLTIASDIVTATQTTHKVETEGGAGTDDLVTINGGVEGAIIILEPLDDAHTVVLKHNTGNIFNKTGADVSLDNYGDTWMARYDGTKWLQL